MIRFAIQELLSEEECYIWLREQLHPEGMRCPNGHQLPEGQAPHDRKRSPLVKYRCRECGAVYNMLSGTIWSKTHMDCRTITLLLRGVSKGASTQMLSEELEMSYKTALK